MIRAPLFAEPCGDHPGWYIADAEMRDVLGVVYISKRAAVALDQGNASGCGAASEGGRDRAISARPPRPCAGRRARRRLRRRGWRESTPLTISSPAAGFDVVGDLVERRRRVRR